MSKCFVKILQLNIFLIFFWNWLKLAENVNLLCTGNQLVIITKILVIISKLKQESRYFFHLNTQKLLVRRRTLNTRANFTKFFTHYVVIN